MKITIVLEDAADGTVRFSMRADPPILEESDVAGSRAWMAGQTILALLRDAGGGGHARPLERSRLN